MDDSQRNETLRAEVLLDAPVGAEGAQQWMHDVVAMLDAAARQLREHDPAAQSTIFTATRVLQNQIALQPTRAEPVGRGGLLAWQVRRVCTYIDGHIAERIRVADLGAVIQLSEAHFSRSFKRTFGKAPHAFVIRRRLEFAAYDLLHGDATVSEIALRYGFADQAHLCKAFRQATGLSPALWRRMRRTQVAEAQQSKRSRADGLELAADIVIEQVPCVASGV